MTTEIRDVIADRGIEEILHFSTNHGLTGILAQGAVKVTKNGRLLNTLKAGEPFGEMAYLSAKAPVRGADVTVDEEANIISVTSESLAKASDGCRHKFDRAFMQILVDRLSAANLKLSGV